MVTSMPSQTIFINSANSARPGLDTPYRFSIDFEPDQIKCNPDERMVLSLKRMAALATWSWIPRDCTFTVGNDSTPFTSSVTLTMGNPSFDELVKSINDQLGKSIGVVCSFVEATNHVAFTAASGEVVLDFTEDPLAAALLGFGTELTPLPAPVLESALPMKDSPFDTIKVHVRGVNTSAASENVSNLTGQQMTTTSCIGAFIVNAEPWSWLDFVNDGPTVFNMSLEDRVIRTMHFEITDFDDVPLYALSQNYIILQIDKEPRVSDVERLTNIVRALIMTQLASGS